jgi:hypothetical protein
MSTKKPAPKKKYTLLIVSLVCAGIVFATVAYLFSETGVFSGQYNLIGLNPPASSSAAFVPLPPPPPPELDRAAYDAKMLQLANYPVVIATTTASSTHRVTSSSTATIISTTTPSSTMLARRWPVKTVYPNYGALLPFNRIVAYYGNFLSTQMGILGQYPPDQVAAQLEDTVAQWQAADPTTPVIPAVDYIAVTAQGSPGADGKYRLRMPDSEIQKAIVLANQVHGIVLLDIQVGLSDVQTELPLLAKYLALPNVHLALDPEFSMKNGKPPGTVIGTMDASDINFAAQFLATIVRENNLTPKILVVHRFTEDMVTNSAEIVPLPEVQIVMDMDGWSTPLKKIKIYNEVVRDYPVQFTGIKLFYKNDLLQAPFRLLTPAEILSLMPQPSFIQYQ